MPLGVVRPGGSLRKFILHGFALPISLAERTLSEQVARRTAQENCKVRRKGVKHVFRPAFFTVGEADWPRNAADPGD